MRSITYVSAAAEGVSEPQLVELLGDVRAKNDRLGLTGILLYRAGRIMQTLEGDDDTVTRVFDQIVDDPRHRDVFVIINEQLDERQFPSWSMGFRHISALPARDGFSSFMDEDADRAFDGDSSMATRMLTLFRAGGI